MEAVKHPSPQAQQLLNEYNLGSIQAEYSDNLLKKALLFAALLPIGLFILALLLSNLTNRNWWPQIINLSPGLLMGSCLSLLGIVGVIMLVITFWRGENRLYLGNKGFVSTRRQVEAVVRWNTVAEIHKHILFIRGAYENVRQIKSICSYTVIPTEGKQCSFTAEPGLIIEEAVTTYQLPGVLENYANGKMLSFGWLALDGNGLHLTPETTSASNPTALTKLPNVAHTSQKLQGTCVESGELFLPWEQLTCYWIDESRSTLILSRRVERKHWAILPLYQIANPTLCLALIEHACYKDTRESAQLLGEEHD